MQVFSILFAVNNWQKNRGDFPRLFNPHEESRNALVEAAVYGDDVRCLDTEFREANQVIFNAYCDSKGRNSDMLDISGSFWPKEIPAMVEEMKAEVCICPVTQYDALSAVWSLVMIDSGAEFSQRRKKLRRLGTEEQKQLREQALSRGEFSPLFYDYLL